MAGPSSSPPLLVSLSLSLLSALVIPHFSVSSLHLFVSAVLVQRIIHPVFGHSECPKVTNGGLVTGRADAPGMCRVSVVGLVVDHAPSVSCTDVTEVVVVVGQRVGPLSVPVGFQFAHLALSVVDVGIEPVQSDHVGKRTKYRKPSEPPVRVVGGICIPLSNELCEHPITNEGIGGEVGEHGVFPPTADGTPRIPRHSSLGLRKPKCKSGT
mmetsp:Transcript_40060/g.78981  ORF Transcript_40060/g.78981 Transcript_40060/m.78981 type:complete len:211 (-) Transcript_40060:296-928(-)